MTQQPNPELHPSDSTSLPPNLFSRSSGFPSRRGRKEKTDQAVRETDTDAALARLSAASLGYIDDPFVPLLLRDSPTSVRRPPWVNIGTHHRTYILDLLILHFLNSTAPIDPKTGLPRPKQILSLGAGSDSRFWRLRNHWSGTWPVSMWVETDFPESTSVKASRIASNERLSSLCGEYLSPSNLPSHETAPQSAHCQNPTELYSKHYTLLSSDLRSTQELIPKLKSVLNPDGCTLILAELVLVYLSPSDSLTCLQHFSDALAPGPVMLLSYEALDLGDNFSRVMVQNLQVRGLELLGLAANRSVKSLADRFRQLGFQASASIDITSLRSSDLSASGPFNRQWQKELDRIRRLESIDELEELHLVLAHYAVSWAIMRYPGAQIGKNHLSEAFCLPELGGQSA
ncbi:S-adenosyl-L-methionine-dependent methyltransferase [Melampsora americana]|nr:S-adenosyl-L-methionine-dependent methyltransferase [Melampsora americana]